jgi:hypothetical protein
VIVLIYIILFMRWPDITLNALLLLIMLYVKFVELYNICLMHDGQYWWHILTMEVSLCAWCCCCMHSCCWIKGQLLVNLKSHCVDEAGSWFRRWWNQWDVIGGDGSELMTLILGGDDLSGEPERSRIGTTCIESSCWVSLHYTLVAYVMVLVGY